MAFSFTWLEFSILSIIVGVFQYFISLWISERLKTSLQKEHSTFLESLKWDLKVQEQAVKVAEYPAVARNLQENSSKFDYQKANQMSWELAIWLPEELYKKMVCAIASPGEKENELTTIISIRKFLLKEKAGNLTSEDIAHHAPNIGKK